MGVSIGDPRPAREAHPHLLVVEDALQLGPPLDHFRPGIATRAVDTVRNATAGALGCGQRSRANPAAATVVREQARIVREYGGGGGGRCGCGEGSSRREEGLEKEQVEARIGRLLLLGCQGRRGTREVRVPAGIRQERRYERAPGRGVLRAGFRDICSDFVGGGGWHGWE